MAIFNTSFLLPVHTLIGDGGPASTYQLTRKAIVASATHNGQIKRNTVIAVYETHKQAEDGIRTLQAATLSIAGKDTHIVEQVSGSYTAGDRMLHWGARGAFWGGVWGLLFDSALLAIPGTGSVLLASPLVSWIIAVLEGAIVLGGLSALGAGLASIGISRHSVLEYEAALKTDQYLLMVHGTLAAKLLNHLPSVAKKRSSAFDNTVSSVPNFSSVPMMGVAPYA